MALQVMQTKLQDAKDSCLPGGAQAINISNMTFDGTGTITYTFDGASITFSPPTSGIRALYFDARGLNADALITISGGPTFRIPTGKQGFVPLFGQWPILLTISSAAGVGPLLVSLFNFKISPIIW